MRCPYCGAPDTQVIDSRLSNAGEQVRRRRRCRQCGERFNTHEAVTLELPRVVKRDGTCEPFDENKLRNGILRAVEKRPVGAVAIAAAVSRICRHLVATGMSEISSRDIGERVMDELRVLDQVAYVRFASVYRQFQDVEAFRAEIERLQSAAAPVEHCPPPNDETS